MCANQSLRRLLLPLLLAAMTLFRPLKASASDPCKFNLYLPLVLKSAGGGGAVPSTSSSANTVHADFNGDGCSDLAVGVRYEDIGAAVNAGAVNVLYGSSGGLSATDDQFWHQDSSGVQDIAEGYEYFGWALAAGDFDGDGFADLAVGVPGEDIDVEEDAGAVQILYGSAGGLSSADDQFWYQDSPDVEDAPEQDDNFGGALAVGDFDGDGYADLAVGVPNEDVGSVVDAGAVNVLYGSAAGLSAAGDQFWHQDSIDVEDVAQDSDYFGSALATGDFDGDGYADLAVGVPYEDVDSVGGAGAVNVLYGSAGGLWAAGDQFWHQDSTDIEGVAEDVDTFGSSLAAGDFDSDGYADLAIGVPGESLLSGIMLYEDAGVVNLLYGSAAGLSAAGDQYWHQGSTDVEDAVENFDRFGSTLAAGDFDGDGYADLAVGVPGESVGAVASAGAVNLLYGSAGGLSAANDQVWHQDSPEVEDYASVLDSFGSALAVGDFDGDGYADLAVGVYYEDTIAVIDAGGVNVLPGSAGGLSAAEDQFWDQDSDGVEDSAEQEDWFGNALAGGGLDGDGAADAPLTKPQFSVEGQRPTAWRQIPVRYAAV